MSDPVAYWNLDEASGTRDDAVGANNLTDNNTVTQAVGKVSNAAQFTRANNEWLEGADSADLSYSGNFSFSCWAYLDSEPAGGILGIAGKGNAGATQREWYLAYRQSTDRFEFYVFHALGGTAVGIEATTFGAVTTGTWYFICCRWTESSGTVEIGVNGGTFDSAADAGIDPQNGTSAFTLGRRFADETGNNFDGRIDEADLTKAVLTADEVTTRYNGGSGNTYPFPTYKHGQFFHVMPF